MLSARRFRQRRAGAWSRVLESMLDALSGQDVESSVAR